MCKAAFLGLFNTSETTAKSATDTRTLLAKCTNATFATLDPVYREMTECRISDGASCASSVHGEAAKSIVSNAKACPTTPADNSKCTALGRTLQLGCQSAEDLCRATPTVDNPECTAATTAVFASCNATRYQCEEAYVAGAAAPYAGCSNITAIALPLCEEKAANCSKAIQTEGASDACTSQSVSDFAASVTAIDSCYTNNIGCTANQTLNQAECSADAASCSASFENATWAMVATEYLCAPCKDKLDTDASCKTCKDYWASSPAPYASAATCTKESRQQHMDCLSSQGKCEAGLLSGDTKDCGSAASKVASCKATLDQCYSSIATGTPDDSCGSDLATVRGECVNASKTCESYLMDLDIGASLDQDELAKNGCDQTATFDALQDGAQCPLNMLACSLYTENPASFAGFKTNCDYFSTYSAFVAASCADDADATDAPTGSPVELISTVVANKPEPLALTSFCDVVKSKLFANSPILQTAVECATVEVSNERRRSLLVGGWKMYATIMAALSEQADLTIKENPDLKMVSADIMTAVNALPAFASNQANITSSFASTPAPSSAPTTANPTKAKLTLSPVVGITDTDAPTKAPSVPVVKFQNSATAFVPSMIALVSLVSVL